MRPDRVGDQPEERKEHAQERDLHGRVRRIGVDELREERQEEERRLRVQDVDDDALRERAAKVALAAERDVGLGMPREERPQAEPDEVHRARDLDSGERDGGRQDERGEPERRRRDVHERPDMNAEHRGDARAASVLDRAGHDVEHRRAGHEEQGERREDEEPDRRRVGDHAFSSQTSRRPSNVRKGSMRPIVSECGATRSARPPVATAGASTPSSPRIRPTMPST